MRILVADRNGRLLESISRTFAGQFSIQTATSHEQCHELLRAGVDLAIVSEKLVDGAGLKLLGEIARNSPDTLRVFVARRARLQILEGKLGPFGLFRTLGYPIIPRELLSVLTLARTGLEVDPPALEIRAAPARARLVAQSIVERISLTSPDAAIATNVPKTIASMKRVRHPNSRRPPPPMPARQVLAREAVEYQPRTAPPNVVSPPARPAPVAPRATGASRPRTAHAPHPSAAPPTVHPGLAEPQTSGTAQPNVAPSPVGAARVEGAPRATGASRPRTARAPHPSAAPPTVHPAPAVPQTSGTAEPDVARPPAYPAPVVLQVTAAPRHIVGPRQPRPAPVVPPMMVAPRRRKAAAAAPRREPTRTKLAVGATVVVVFLLTTLTLNLLDSSVHVTHASAPPPRAEQPPTPEPPSPVPMTPAFTPTQRVAQHVEPKPADPEPAPEQVAASAGPPIADPSTFGSEAYEPIYSN